MESQQVEKVLQQNSSLKNTNCYLLIQDYCIDMLVKTSLKIINTFQMTLIKKNKKICVEGRDIASKILAKNPKYDLAFYFKCNIKVASYRRWLDIKKKVSLQNVRKSLTKRTSMDKKRKNSPLIKVKDAILIRTDKFNKKQVLSKMSEHIESLN